MPYACVNKIDNNMNRYVGWKATAQSSTDYVELWKPERLLSIQKTITELLKGVKPVPIIVSFDVIGNVLSQCYESHRPPVGDIYSRYIQWDIDSHRDDVRDIVDRTIEIIVRQIRNEYETEENNKKLTIWNTVYGDFNQVGLRQHPPIKLRNRRSNRMMFNMKY